MYQIFQLNKFPGDNEMSEYIYSALLDAYSDEVEKINSSKGGWKTYWMEVLQASVNEFIN